MTTYTFVGSDKNAGKTTVLNYIYKEQYNPSKRTNFCLTSIGINGEAVDVLYGNQKPSVTIFSDTYFITSERHLTHLERKIRKIKIISRFPFKQRYIIGRAKEQLSLILEGPNTKKEILIVKQELEDMIDNLCLYIDGSVDRQFVAHPDISDFFYFSLLISGHDDQLKKARNLVSALSFPNIGSTAGKIIKSLKKKNTKSLLFSEDYRILYHGRAIPFMDDNLATACKENREQNTILYLNGALSPGLYELLSSLKIGVIVLDNFTLYLAGKDQKAIQEFDGINISLLYPVRLEGIFLHRDGRLSDSDYDAILSSFSLPHGIAINELKVGKGGSSQVFPRA